MSPGNPRRPARAVARAVRLVRRVVVDCWRGWLDEAYADGRLRYRLPLTLAHPLLIAYAVWLWAGCVVGDWRARRAAGGRVKGAGAPGAPESYPSVNSLSS